MNATWLAVAVAAQLGSFVALAEGQRHLLAAGGSRVPLPAMVGLTLEANALNAALPGGTAVAAGYSLRRYRSWGASTPAATFAVLASGLLSALMLSALLLAWALTGGGAVARTAEFTAAPGVVLAAVALCVRQRGARLVPACARVLSGRQRAPRVISRVARFAAELSAVRPKRAQWCAGLGHAGVNWVADLGCLVACWAAADAGTPRLHLVTAAYVAGVVANGLSLLPAGLGTTDVAMVAALTGGGMSAAPAAGTVLCYRLVSVGLVVGIGLVLVGRRRARLPRRTRGRRPRWASLLVRGGAMRFPVHRSMRALVFERQPPKQQRGVRARISAPGPARRRPRPRHRPVHLNRT